MLDERPPELAMVGPDLAKDGVDLRLCDALSPRERAHDLCQDQAPAAFSSRPLDDASVPPERTQLSRLLGGAIPIRGGHVPL